MLFLPEEHFKIARPITPHAGQNEIQRIMQSLEHSRHGRIRHFSYALILSHALSRQFLKLSVNGSGRG